MARFGDPLPPCQSHVLITAGNISPKPILTRLTRYSLPPDIVKLEFGNWCRSQTRDSKRMAFYLLSWTFETVVRESWAAWRCRVNVGAWLGQLSKGLKVSEKRASRDSHVHEFLGGGRTEGLV